MHSIGAKKRLKFEVKIIVLRGVASVGSAHHTHPQHRLCTVSRGAAPAALAPFTPGSEILRGGAPVWGVGGPNACRKCLHFLPYTVYYIFIPYGVYEMREMHKLFMQNA